jgi:lysyl-tRNA synthetase, class II
MQLLSEQEIERRKDREELMKLGIDPYPAESFPINVTAADIHANYENRKLIIKTSPLPEG